MDIGQHTKDRQFHPKVFLFKKAHIAKQCSATFRSHTGGPLCQTCDKTRDKARDKTCDKTRDKTHDKTCDKTHDKTRDKTRDKTGNKTRDKTCLTKGSYMAPKRCTTLFCDVSFLG